MRRGPLLLAAAGMTLALIAAALLAPLLAPYDPYAMSPAARLLPPSAAHWAGTDEIGRDLFSRLIWGARVSLSAALGIVAIAATLGTLIGGFSGLVGGWVDMAIMRVNDMVMALPGLVIGLALAAALGPSLVNLVLALGLLGVPSYIRLARGQALSLRSRLYVQAARAMGASTSRLWARHILPHMLPTLGVYATMHMSGAILAASALSFIGVGAQPPLPEWGAMVNAARNYALDAWWYATFPGLAVTLAAFSFNILGDGLRDLLDPKATR